MTDQDRRQTIPFHVSGSGNRAFVFIHGFLDAGSIWDRVVGGLEAQDARKVTLDLPGMGALTADPGRIDLQRYADDVGAIVDALSVPVVLVAQSMGAQIAELVAAARPKQVTGMVLITPVPLQGVHAPDEMIAPFKALGGDLDAQRQLRRMLAPNMTAADLDILTELGRDVSASSVRQLVDAWNSGVNEAPSWSDFDGPALVIRGGADSLVTQEMATAIAKRFKGPPVKTLDGAGHWAHFEAAGQVANLIVEFIDQLAWRSGAASDWKNAFAQKSASTFADAFADDVVLEAAVLVKPVVGRDNVKRVMEAAASKIYARVEFTESANDGSQQYLQWEADDLDGVAYKGITIISRNAAGKIANVAIHHRPLGALLGFSYKLGQHLKGVIDAGHFATAESIPEQLRK
ncbi:alpha/beta fold hydrolase [Rhizobium mayense]|uniref:Alpha/beta hydrolase n=1 Tax=Rhizobium mayense TaxID=1312184 RepID=A0ABT7JX07_9HYPH|nr:alpha/beta hydrolase [Rhizobium mayense]MDL2400293.1 alpha/beta hydrolase [Rhizobium mayense]